MSPRCVVAGRTYLVTRRCSERRFFLRPSKKVNEIVRYALAKAATLWGVRVSAFTVLSNHLHLVVTDIDGVLPTFMHALDLEISKAVSPEIGRWGGLWEPRQSYSAVELLDVDAIVDKIAYVLANPVTAGLVPRATKWPGVSSAGMAFGDVVHAPKPDTAYYRNSPQPAFYDLRLEPPPELDPAEYLERIRARVRELEKRAKVELHAQGHEFLGVNRILRQDPHDNPTSWEKRRGLNPTYASRDKWKRIEAAQRNRSWLAAYRDALERFRAGLRDVVFPIGCWSMVRIFGCNCARVPG